MNQVRNLYRVTDTLKWTYEMFARVPENVRRRWTFIFSLAPNKQGVARLINRMILFLIKYFIKLNV